MAVVLAGYQINKARAVLTAVAQAAQEEPEDLDEFQPIEPREEKTPNCDEVTQIIDIRQQVRVCVYAFIFAALRVLQYKRLY